MRSFTILVLLLATLLPSLLVGRPVYHCHRTGNTRLSCACEACGQSCCETDETEDATDEAQVEATCPHCCSADDTVTTPEPQPTGFTHAPCCTVSRFTVAFPRPATTLEYPEVAFVELPPTRGSPDAVASPCRGTIRLETSYPPGNPPPLQVLYTRWLI